MDEIRAALPPHRFAQDTRDSDRVSLAAITLLTGRWLKRGPTRQRVWPSVGYLAWLYLTRRNLNGELARLR